MNVIFLDVDGVLNTPKTIRKFGIDFIDNIAVKLVEKIVNETNAKIVLSSTWRIDEKNKNMVEDALSQCNLQIYDCTPVIENGGWWIQRCEEIQTWLDQNPNVIKFAIIDDLEEAKIEGSFFQTNENIGLNVEITEKIIQHFAQI